MATLTKRQVVIEWTMLDHGMIKFVDGSDNVYEISEKAISFLQSKPETLTEGNLPEGTNAEVEIDESKGDNGTVEIIKLLGSETKTAEKTESKTTETKSTNDENVTVKKLTVKGVSVQKRSVTFNELDGVWFNLDEGINADDLKKLQKSLVEVSIKSNGKGNDIIVRFKELKQEKSETKNDFKKTTNGDSSVQRSIEAQAAVNSANRVVASLVSANIDLDENGVKNAIASIAKNNFNLIQELKNS